MNILLVIDCLGSGGAQRQIVTLAKGLVDLGHNVSLLNYYPGHDHFRAEALAHNITVIDAPKRRRFSISVAWSIRQSVRSHTIHAVISFLTTPNIYSILGCIGLSKVPLIVSERYMFEGSTISWTTRLSYFLYRFADLVTINSNHQRERVARLFPAVGRKSVTVFNGVDLEIFQPKAHKPASNAVVDLLAIGTLVPKKNATNLIHAIDLCKRAGITVVVHWVGAYRGGSADDNATRLCEEQLSTLGLEKQWNWMGLRNDIPDLMREFECVIHPSFYEGLPNVLCEALASGNFILASDVCDHPILLGDGERGILFDPAKPESIAHAIQSYSQLSTEDIAKIRRAARVFAESELSKEKFVQTYLDFVEAMVDRETVHKSAN